MNVKHKIAVYGTLRPATGEAVEIPGKIYDLGWFPGLVLDDSGATVKGTWIEVDDVRLAQLDRYEGYREDFPDKSLYLRKPFQGGWVYVYNRSIGDRALIETGIESGDWLAYTVTEKGVAASCN